MNIHTFRNGEETDDYEGITVCTPYIVAYVTNRGIEGVVFIIAGAHRDSGLVATENNWD
jgi:molybdate-binding protein